MAKRTSLSDRKNNDPLNSLFSSVPEEVKVEKEEAIDDKVEEQTADTSDAKKESKVQVKKKAKTANKETSAELVPRTYYITPELQKALELYKAFENKDLSETVRAALAKSIPKKYQEMAKDFFEE